MGAASILAGEMGEDPKIKQRKSDHLRIVTEEDVAYRQGTLLDGIHLLHNALPEMSLGDIDTSCEFFGKWLAAPLMITSMTGGAEHAAKLNRELAQVAEATGIAFSVGSQKVMLRHPDTRADFAVREHIPKGVLLGNIGGTLLAEHGAAKGKELSDAIEADGICVHLNAAQELAQPEGDRDFRGVLAAITELNELMEGRVLVKETGAGLSPHVCSKLAANGIRYIDVSGAGGTSWTKVEAYRAEDEADRLLGEALADWGIPTALCIIAAGRVCPEQTQIIGSGGVMDGRDAALAIAAGADIAGIARSVLAVYMQGGMEAAEEYVKLCIRQLRSVMILSGSADVKSLQSAPRIYKGELREWLAQLDGLLSRGF